MDIRVMAVLLVASIDFLVAAILYIQPRRDISRTVYSLFSFAVALWGWGVALFLLINNVTLSDLFARALYFFGGFIAPSFYYFTLVFIDNKKTSFYTKVLIFLPTTILFYLYFFTNDLISGYSLINGVKGFKYGQYSWLFDLHLWFFLVLALLMLFKKYKNATDPHYKSQIVFITLGTYTALAIASITNVFYPFFNIFHLIWVGPTATILWVTIVAYALQKHQLLNVKIITTELFVSFIWLACIVETALSQSNNELIRKFLMLVVGVGIFGYFLIKSVHQEVRTKEKIENLAASLEGANTELKRLDRAKSEFISIASHQLRTPLTIIKGYLSMIREGNYGAISSDIATTINKMYLSNERLIKLVNDLLDLSRMESGRMKYEFAEMDLEEVVDSTVDEFQLPAKDKKVKFIWKKDERGFPKIWGDAWKLRQVTFNLIDNALKYNREGDIEIKLKKEDDGLTLSVKDSGIGMSEETINNIFHKFSRGRESVVAKVNAVGVGLGLYIAKRIVDDHGGQIWVTSEGEGKGSVFYVKLPLASMHDHDKSINELTTNA